MSKCHPVKRMQLTTAGSTLNLLSNNNKPATVSSLRCWYGFWFFVINSHLRSTQESLDNRAKTETNRNRHGKLHPHQNTTFSFVLWIHQKRQNTIWPFDSRNSVQLCLHTHGDCTWGHRIPQPHVSTAYPGRDRKRGFIFYSEQRVNTITESTIRIVQFLSSATEYCGIV